MKKIWFGILAGTLLWVSGCAGSQNGLPEETSVQEETMVEKEEETGDEATWNTLISMIGKSDEETAEMLNGGEQNVTEDGILIGRIFETKLFGEPVTAGTLCDENSLVTTVTMQLAEPDAETYSGMLREQKSISISLMVWFLLK